jgi:hypothetical protein
MKYFFALLFTVALAVPAQLATAQLSSPLPLTGHAWSSNIGWVSFNGPGYQVQIDTDGDLSGHAWSSNLGWLQFDGLSSFPAGGGAAQVDFSTNAISGFARFCAATDGGTNDITAEIVRQTPQYSLAPIQRGVWETQVRGMVVSPDGQTVLVSTVGDNTIHEIRLATPWDATTGSFTGNVLDLSFEMRRSYGMVYNEDGTELFIADDDTSGPTIDFSIHRVFLTGDPYRIASTAYDAEYDIDHSPALDPEPFRVGEMQFIDDGNRMIVGSRLYWSGPSPELTEYRLTTPYDPTTAEFVQSVEYDENIPGAPGDGSNKIPGFEFTPDGRQIIVEWSPNFTETVATFDLSTPFDISTASFHETGVIDGSIDIQSAMHFNGDGSKMLSIVDISTHEQRLVSYDLSVPYDISGTVVEYLPGDCSSMDPHVDANGWSGWVSLNCSTTGACGTSNYGLTANGGAVEGFSWGGGGSNASTSLVGWLRFDGHSNPVRYTPPGGSLSCTSDLSGYTSTNQWGLDNGTTSCPVGFLCDTMNPGTCIADTVTVTQFDVVPRRVREQGQATVDWNTDAVGSCTLYQQNPGGVNDNSWTGTSGSITTDAVENLTVMSLHCTNTADPLQEEEVASTTISVIPVNVET